jgi:hypothetical protein
MSSTFFTRCAVQTLFSMKKSTATDTLNTICKQYRTLSQYFDFLQLVINCGSCYADIAVNATVAHFDMIYDIAIADLQSVDSKGMALAELLRFNPNQLSNTQIQRIKQITRFLLRPPHRKLQLAVDGSFIPIQNLNALPYLSVEFLGEHVYKRIVQLYLRTTLTAPFIACLVNKRWNAIVLEEDYFKTLYEKINISVVFRPRDPAVCM